MTGTGRNKLPASLSDRISGAFGSIWTQYAKERPSAVRTEIRGNVITCRLIDAVGVFNRRMIDPVTDAAGGAGKLSLVDYKRDAVAAVVGLTRQRVTSFVSSHDPDTDVATEVFTLEPSLRQGRARSLTQREALRP